MKMLFQFLYFKILWQLRQSLLYIPVYLNPYNMLHVYLILMKNYYH